MSRELRERLREVYKETICKVKVGGEIGKHFRQQKKYGRDVFSVRSYSY